MNPSLTSMLINGKCLSLVLLGLQLTGDRVQRSEGLHYALKAALDSGVHGLVAGISWLIVIADQGGRFYSHHGEIYEVTVCACLGSVIDVDHFIEARSLKLKEAMQLKKRPLFHSTTLLLVVVVSLALLSIVTSSSNLWRASLVVLVAGLSHHLRDGFRRGLWVPPYGSTPPVPYSLYLLSSIVLPQIVRFLLAQPQTNVNATFSV